MMLDATVGDLRIHVSTEGYPPSVRIGVPYRAGQHDIVMSFDEAQQIIDTLQPMLAKVRREADLY